MTMRPLVKILMLLPCVALYIACDDIDTAAPMGPDDRGPIGKADLVGTCWTPDGNACGGQAEGNCWCDDACEDYGDCCDDKVEICDEPFDNPCVNEGYSCFSPGGGCPDGLLISDLSCGGGIEATCCAPPLPPVDGDCDGPGMSCYAPGACPQGTQPVDATCDLAIEAVCCQDLEPPTPCEDAGFGCYVDSGCPENAEPSELSCGEGGGMCCQPATPEPVDCEEAGFVCFENDGCPEFSDEQEGLICPEGFSCCS